MIRNYALLSCNRILVIDAFSPDINGNRFIMYFKGICLNNFSQKNHFYLLPSICLLALISFGFFCYDNDPFDDNDLPDFSCQYPSISHQHINQVTFINILNQSNQFSLLFTNSLLPRSPPI